MGGVYLHKYLTTYPQIWNIHSKREFPGVPFSTQLYSAMVLILNNKNTFTSYFLKYMPSCRQFTHFWRQLLWTGKQNPPTFLRFRMSDMEWYVHKCKSAHSPMLASTAKEAALLRLCSDLDSAQLWVISVQCGGSSLHAVQCALNWTTLALQCFTTLLTTRSRVQLQCHILPSTDLYNCALVSFHRSGSLHNWLQ